MTRDECAEALDALAVLVRKDALTDAGVAGTLRGLAERIDPDGPVTVVIPRETEAKIYGSLVVTLFDCLRKLSPMCAAGLPEGWSWCENYGDWRRTRNGVFMVVCEDLSWGVFVGADGEPYRGRGLNGGCAGSLGEAIEACEAAYREHVGPEIPPELVGVDVGRAVLFEDEGFGSVFWYDYDGKCCGEAFESDEAGEWHYDVRVDGIWYDQGPRDGNWPAASREEAIAIVDKLTGYQRGEG